MKKLFMVFCFVLNINCSLLIAADNKEIEKAVRDDFQGKLLLLRGLPTDKKLTFDSSVKLTSDIHAGPWSGAVFEMEKVQSKKTEVRIFGACPMLLVPDPGTPRKIEIDIQLPTSLTAQEFVSLIRNQVFITDSAELDSLLPKPWPDVISGTLTVDKKAGIAGFTPNGEMIYRIKPGMTPPKPLHTPDPEYSEEARKSKYQGTVVLVAVINQKGEVMYLRVSRAIGKGLDENAMQAVRQWTFRPAELNGRPVAVLINIEVSFNLN